MFVVIVAAVAGFGLWLGMLAAPHIGRLAERHDDEPDDAAQDAGQAEPGAPGETSGRRDDE